MVCAVRPLGGLSAGKVSYVAETDRQGGSRDPSVDFSGMLIEHWPTRRLSEWGQADEIFPEPLGRGSQSAQVCARLTSVLERPKLQYLFGTSRRQDAGRGASNRSLVHLHSHCRPRSCQLCIRSLRRVSGWARLAPSLNRVRMGEPSDLRQLIVGLTMRRSSALSEPTTEPELRLKALTPGPSCQYHPPPAAPWP